jgi:hypothetical protein
MSDSIHWRGFIIPPDPRGEFDHWVYDDHIYIGITKEEDGTWGACIGVGELEGSSDVAINAQSALETALADLKKELGRHDQLIAEAFP